jgi:DNA segregation ATPase FtsK/SpoIIIE, S-DNA-T family
MSQNEEQTTTSPINKKFEVILFILMLLTFFSFLALYSYSDLDSIWNQYNTQHEIKNLQGPIGALFADIGYTLFGYAAFFFPILFSIQLFKQIYCYTHNQKKKLKPKYTYLFQAIGFFLLLIHTTALSSLYLPYSFNLPTGPGGIIGQSFSWSLLNLFNEQGTLIFLIFSILIYTRMLINFSWIYFFECLGFATFYLFTQTFKAITWLTQAVMSLCTYIAKKATTPKSTTTFARPLPQSNESINNQMPEQPIEPRISVEEDELVPNPQEAPQANQSLLHLPFNLLNQTPCQDNPIQNKNLETMARLIEQRLLEFGIQASVMAAHPGPVITRYELNLAPGTKASKISNLAKDIARSLSVHSVRIVEVIPGKSYVGLELPNTKREIVHLHDIIVSKQHQESHSPLTIALGKDIAGIPYVADLKTMPHLLIAGTTGSGKSVCINALLISLLYKTQPSELRMILIDPKMLELAIYEGIPHLLAPVVTQMHEAAQALQWCVNEMERRYRLMAHVGVRNLEGYNQKVKQSLALKKPLMSFENNLNGQPIACEPMPNILIIADEFADLMMVTGKTVEQLIARLAQKARAAGIHLILATQRPSVDVITGLIKANIPTRIAFQVATRVDARTILDQQGAEQLLGHGDMLYLPSGASLPIRIHGALVTDEEIHRVAQKLKAQQKPTYIEAITQAPRRDFNQDALHTVSPESDTLYDAAVHFILKQRKVSVSLIQRQFKIGYNRAARMVDAMEQAGIVSSMETNGTRTVLIPQREEDAEPI